MTAIHIVDDTFIRAPHDVVARAVRDRARWAIWWPDLTLTVTEDRGPLGVRWTVDGPVAGVHRTRAAGPSVVGGLVRQLDTMKARTASATSCTAIAASSRPAIRVTSVVPASPSTRWKTPANRIAR